MKFIREDVLAGKQMAGIWCTLGSPHTALIAAATGFDWILLDGEHGAGGHETLRNQITAIEGSESAAIARVASNDPVLFKKALDMGASGVMVPYIKTAEEASMAVAATRYPPMGFRGVSASTCATAFGATADTYIAQANQNLLTVIQVETAEAVDNIDAIAAVDGVDVLFIGPADLTYNLGIPRQLDHPDFLKAKAAVIDACKTHGKAAGIFLKAFSQVDQARKEGFSFIALGADSSLVVKGMEEIYHHLKL